MQLSGKRKWSPGNTALEPTLSHCQKVGSGVAAVIRCNWMFINTDTHTRVLELINERYLVVEAPLNNLNFFLFIFNEN